MAFKPMKQDRPQGGDFENTRDLPVPRAGSRYARVSLIVDMGVQEREDFEDEKTGEKKPQKPCQQVAVYADLVKDVVDYGKPLGKRQYRLCLNKSFMGKVVGINFTTGPAKNAKGEIQKDKPWCLHPQNALTKLAKVTGLEEIIHEVRNNPKSLDISLLLDQPFMANVEVKETPDKNDKKDKDGNLIIYKNVNYRGPAAVPMDDNDEPLPVAELTEEARCITFDSATAEDIKFIRAGLLKQIKLANNYAGSQMQAAIEEFEAENGGDDSGGEQEQEQEEKPAPKPAAKKAAPAAAKKKPASAPVEDSDDDTPF